MATPMPMPSLDPTTYNPLTELDAKQRVEARRLAMQINPKDTTSITSFASGAQQQMSASTDPMLAMVRAKDAGKAGELLTNLLQDTKSLDPKSLQSQGNVLAKLPLVGQMFDQARGFIAQYEKVGDKIGRITHDLETEMRTLTRDIKALDRLFEDNKIYFQQLKIYIAAGEMKLQELRREHEALQQQAVETGDPFKAQEANDLGQTITRLEQRVYDLKLTAVIALQTGPQIRLVQASDQTLAEKIQQSILTTIPLWKQQIVIAIGLFNQKKALQLQRQVSQATNDLLKTNAQLLHEGVTEVARETQRGVVDVETLVHTHESLIKTIEDTIRIQQEGRAQRVEGERKMNEMTQQMSSQLSAAQSRALPA